MSGDLGARLRQLVKELRIADQDWAADELDAALTETPAPTPFYDNGTTPNRPHDYQDDPETGCCVICGWAEQTHTWPSDASAALRRPRKENLDVDSQVPRHDAESGEASERRLRTDAPDAGHSIYQPSAGRMGGADGEGARDSTDTIAALRRPTPPPQLDVVWRIEVFREDDGRFAADFRSGDDSVGGMSDYAATPVGALANLCATLIKVAEDDASEKSRPVGGSDLAQRLRNAFAEGFTMARRDTASVDTSEWLIEEFWQDSKTLREAAAAVQPRET